MVSQPVYTIRCTGMTPQYRSAGRVLSDGVHHVLWPIVETGTRVIAGCAALLIAFRHSGRVLVSQGVRCGI
ncbi:hypothetical protein KCP69_26580 (plasmid) [Salmonella enterica subsp. enterica]|nr:hypothetical protein KCP69_26580 [Salmonella enterica subsp. enterica]